MKISENITCPSCGQPLIGKTFPCDCTWEDQEKALRLLYVAEYKKEVNRTSASEVSKYSKIVNLSSNLNKNRFRK